MMARSKSVGRRPGGHDTRGEILAVSRHDFAARGFDATSVRAIASDAGVDPALVHHYFGSKEQLFVAAMDLAVDPTFELARIMAADSATIGQNLVRLQLAAWGAEGGRESMLALVRSATSNEAAAAMLREFLGSALLSRMDPAFGGAPDARLRAEAAASHLVGLAFARYVVRLPALAEAPDDELVRLVGAAVQTYFDGARS
jgi:AcrR family transcriptional regulator